MISRVLKTSPASSIHESHCKRPQGRACTSHLFYVCGFQSFLVCRSLRALYQGRAFQSADNRLAFPSFPAHLTRSPWIRASQQARSAPLGLAVGPRESPSSQPSLHTARVGSGTGKVAPTRSSCPNSRRKRRASLSFQRFPSQGMGAVDLPHENA